MSTDHSSSPWAPVATPTAAASSNSSWAVSKLPCRAWVMAELPRSDDSRHPFPCAPRLVQLGYPSPRSRRLELVVPQVLHDHPCQERSRPFGGEFWILHGGAALPAGIGVAAWIAGRTAGCQPLVHQGPRGPVRGQAAMAGSGAPGQALRAAVVPRACTDRVSSAAKSARQRKSRARSSSSGGRMFAAFTSVAASNPVPRSRGLSLRGRNASGPRRVRRGPPAQAG